VFNVWYLIKTFVIVWSTVKKCAGLEDRPDLRKLLEGSTEAGGELNISPGDPRRPASRFGGSAVDANPTINRPARNENYFDVPT
jgi:hypothetical protein